MFAGLALTRLPVGGARRSSRSRSCRPFPSSPAWARSRVRSRRTGASRSRSPSTAVGVAFALRVIADTATGTGWLRWATPLGWVEELRAFAGPRPAVLLLSPCVALRACWLLAMAIAAPARRRLRAPAVRGTPPSRGFALLSSPLAQALRGEMRHARRLAGGRRPVRVRRGRDLGFVRVGTVEQDAARPREARRRIAAHADRRPELLLRLLRARDQPVHERADRAARHEEAEQRLETLFACPVSRRRWLVGPTAACRARRASRSRWRPACSPGRARRRRVRTSRCSGMLEAGANCLPAAILFLALAALAFAAIPRATTHRRVRRRRRGVHLEPPGRAARRTGLDARALAVPARRARPDPRLPAARGGCDARDRGVGGRCVDRRVRTPRPDRASVSSPTELRPPAAMPSR